MYTMSFENSNSKCFQHNLKEITWPMLMSYKLNKFFVIPNHKWKMIKNQCYKTAHTRKSKKDTDITKISIKSSDNTLHVRHLNWLISVLNSRYIGVSKTGKSARKCAQKQQIRNAHTSLRHLWVLMKY